MEFWQIYVINFLFGLGAYIIGLYMGSKFSDEDKKEEEENTVDFAMCMDHECPLRYKCRRYNSFPGPKQSYHNFNHKNREYEPGQNCFKESYGEHKGVDCNG